MAPSGLTARGSVSIWDLENVPPFTLPWWGLLVPRWLFQQHRLGVCLFS